MKRKRKLQPHDLTFIAESLGKRRPMPLSYLRALSGHPDPVVREGVVYGLSGDVRRGRADLERMAGSDPHHLVREAAREALEP